VLFGSSGLFLVCSLDSCGQKTEDLQKFLSHLKTHLRAGRSICCPFRHCGKTFSVLLSFKSHISRPGRDWDVTCVESNYTTDNEKCDNNVIEMSNTELEQTHCSHVANDFEYSALNYIADSDPDVFDALWSKLAL
jgi:hypothetical protein